MLSSRFAITTLNGIFKRGLNKPLLYRTFTQETKNTTTTGAANARRAMRSKLVTEATNTTSTGARTFPLSIGQGALAGASLLGLGSLAFYGLGFSKSDSIADRRAMWPQFVRERVRNTYEYFAGSVLVSMGSAYAMTRSPAMMQLLSRNSMMALFGSIALMIGSGMLVRSIPKENVVPKHLAWFAHIGIIGAVLAPIAIMTSPAILARAGWYTAGIVGGLSVIAATAPNDKFLNMGAPLAIGLGAVFAASIGSAFLPPTTTLGLSLYSMSLYGGLILFSAFLLYDTQRIVAKAESDPHYDPIDQSISIFMDTVNIFIRLVAIMSGGQRRK